MASLTKFLGLGPRKTAAERAAAAKAADDETRKTKKRGKGETDSDDEREDDEEEDEDDEDEEDGKEEDGRKAVRVRNALRAAGHRRGVAAERGRLATIFNGLDPEKAAMGVQLALDDRTAALPGDQVRAMLDATAAPAPADRTAFGQVMDRVAAILPGPTFAAGENGGGGKQPTLASQMAKMLKLPEAKN
jgi:hypothetical protein